MANEEQKLDPRKIESLYQALVLHCIDAIKGASKR